MNCIVRCKLSGHKLDSLWISLRGDAAHFPSTSNRRTIGYKNTGLKVVPFVRRSNDVLDRLKTITSLYNQEVNTFYADHKVKMEFGTRQVFLLALLAHRPRRADSHNFCKAIADWIQSVHIVNDDSQIEMHCAWKADYTELSADLTSTDIFIHDRTLIQTDLTRHMNALMLL